MHSVKFIDSLHQLIKDGPTCKYDEAIAGFSVAEDAPSQQHVLVGQGVFLLSPVEGTTETIQLVVGGLTHYFTFPTKISKRI